MRTLITSDQLPGVLQTTHSTALTSIKGLTYPSDGIRGLHVGGEGWSYPQRLDADGTSDSDRRCRADVGGRASETLSRRESASQGMRTERACGVKANQPKQVVGSDKRSLRV